MAGREPLLFYEDRDALQSVVVRVEADLSQRGDLAFGEQTRHRYRYMLYTTGTSTCMYRHGNNYRIQA
jgi:hypothetical protein